MTMEQPETKPIGYYAPDPRPLWKRWLQQRFFPQQRLRPLDEFEEQDPTWASSEVSCGMYVAVSWDDRLRVLLAGRVHCEMRLRTDVPVGRTSSRGLFMVQPPKFLERN
jgi:hypothetical protein